MPDYTSITRITSHYSSEEDVIYIRVLDYEEPDVALSGYDASVLMHSLMDSIAKRDALLEEAANDAANEG